MTEPLSIFNARKSTSSQILSCVLEKSINTRIITDKSYRDHDGINGDPTEFEWNIFPGFTTLQLCGEVTDLLSRLREEPETFTDCKGNEEECVADARIFFEGEKQSVKGREKQN